MDTPTPTCPDCGCLLPADAPFCPHCLLRGGLEESELETSDFPTEYSMEGRESEGLESRLMGRYKLGAKLGEGGFGVVFDARQMQPIQRQVAVKVLKADMNARQIIARFEAERQALAMMDHPGISRVLDAGETQDGRPFFVMEKVDGVPVTVFVRQTNPPLRDRLRIFISICEAVHYAHQKGVIHRDLKPSNVLVSVENGVARPKVIDFGLAKALDARLSKHTIYTLHDQVIGTPGYIGPEQIEHGSEAADVRGDVYALGSLFYEMLTGVPAVDQKSLIGKPLEEALREAADRPLVRPSVRDPKLRGDLEFIILKALAADPAQRYASADALAVDVQRHLDDQPVQAHPPDRFYIISKFTRRNRWAVAATLALLLAGVTALWSGAQKLRQEQRHQIERQQDSSRKCFQDARQFSERGRHSDAIANLCYALREDPQNSAAATYLGALLSQQHLGKRLAMDLRVKPGWSRLLQLTINARERIVVAVCGADAEGQTDLIMRWKLDPNSEPPVELGLPAGMKITACQSSADDGFLLLGFSDGSLARYDIASGVFSQFAVKMQGEVTAIALSGDSAHSLVGTAAGDVRLWDLVKQTPGNAAPVLPQRVELVALDAEAKHAVVSHNGMLIALDLLNDKISTVQRPVPEGIVTSLAMNAPGTLVAVGLKNGLVLMMRLPDLTKVGEPLPHGGGITCLNFNRDGRMLVSGDAHGLVNFWRAEETRPIGENVLMNGPVRLCRLLENERQAFAVSERGDLRLWQTDGTTVSVHQAQRQIGATALSQDGTLVALASIREPTLEVWEIQSRMVQPRPWSGPETPTVGQVASAMRPEDPALQLRGNTRIFTTDLDRRVKVTEPATGQQVCGDLYHDTPLRHLALSSDQRTLLTITADGTHRAWDAATGVPLMPSFKRGERATHLRLQPDGRSYLYQRESGDWFELPLPVRLESLPGWFLDFAEARATKRLRADGSSETVPRERQRQIVDALPDSPDPATTLARWLLQKSDERASWPQFSEPKG